MNFLEARRIVSSFPGGDTLPFLFAISGTADPFDLYLKAAAAKRGHTAQIRKLPFNTLAQTLRMGPSSSGTEVFLLLPWDLAPETDWRSGLPASEVNFDELRQRAEVTARLLRERRGARLLYVPAAIPPIFPDNRANDELAGYLVGLAASSGARVLGRGTFSLNSYLVSGCPVGGAFLGDVAEAVIQQACDVAGESCKVLLTDLDNCMWSGVIAEDGLAGIHFGPEGQGYRHFIYQTLLAKLKREGVLLGAVSRNDPEVGTEPLRKGKMTLSESDFVCVVCSYDSKSAQIADIAKRLNLGLNSFVFVDDNPVEVAEVSTRLPEVHCLQFPSQDEGLVQLFDGLSKLFTRSTVTGEDRERTEMYRRELESMAPAEMQGADITEFLRGLEMTLTLHDRSDSGRERAVQLINKTNQFNLNGRRMTDQEVTLALNTGARLYTATLNDRNGTHGEILACLISPAGIITSFVMSCRVFQRRVEYAFLTWLATQPQAPSGLAFLSTSRNEPIRRFLTDPAFDPAGDLVRFDAGRFAADHSNDLALFTLQGQPTNGRHRQEG
jgi:FkbH-like protein